MELIITLFLLMNLNKKLLIINLLNGKKFIKILSMER